MYVCTYVCMYTHVSRAERGCRWKRRDAPVGQLFPDIFLRQHLSDAAAQLLDLVLDQQAKLPDGGAGELLEGVQLALRGLEALDEVFVRLAAVLDGGLQRAGALLQELLQPPGRFGFNAVRFFMESKGSIQPALSVCLFVSLYGNQLQTQIGRRQC